MTILDNIIAEKQKEVIQLKKDPIRKDAPVYEGPTFQEQIRKQKTMGMIAEIKRASPSKGMIHPNVNSAAQAKAYEQHGANAISVLTDAPFFKGSMEDLTAVRKAVQLPILCKDFMIDTIQIDDAKQAGANIILLIAAALPDKKLKELYDYATQAGLEVLVEVHNEQEMERILPLDPALIGVNNRNLKTFEVDLTTTGRIADMVTNPQTILIGESGIRHASDVEKLASSGAEAILIGETLMRSNNLPEMMQTLQIPLPMGTESRQ